MLERSTLDTIIWSGRKKKRQEEKQEIILVEQREVAICKCMDYMLAIRAKGLCVSILMGKGTLQPLNQISAPHRECM